MLIFFIIGCGIIIGGIFFKRTVRLKKDRLEKRAILNQRLEYLILSDKKIFDKENESPNKDG